MHIIMHNLQMLNWIQLKFDNNLFLSVSSDLCHKKILLVSLNIPLIGCFHVQIALTNKHANDINGSSSKVGITNVLLEEGQQYSHPFLISTSEGVLDDATSDEFLEDTDGYAGHFCSNLKLQLKIRGHNKFN